MRVVRAGVMVAFLFAAASAILGLFLYIAGPRGVIGLRHRHTPPGRLVAADPTSAPASSNLPPLLRDVGIDQKLNKQIPLDLLFRDEAGNEVRLGQYFGQKPVVLVLAYYDCPMLCTIALNGVLHSVKELKYNVGREFEIVTVSFDPTEKPSLAAAKKAIYIGLYGRPNAGAGWHFLTGDELSIRQLTQAVGFRYNYDPQTKQYFHAAGIMVVTPGGRLARYFYGIQYPSGNLRLGLVEASEGRIGSPVDQVLLYCSQYDPATGKYSVIVSHVLKIAAAVTVLVLAGLIFAMSLSSERGGMSLQCHLRFLAGGERVRENHDA